MIAVAGALCLAAGLASLAASRAETPSAGIAPRLVLMVMDGFRPDYMNLAPMPHLHALMASGMTYRRAWVGQLTSETPTGHATIATGVYPRKHNVIDFGWRNPTGQGFTWMPTDLRQLAAGDMERQIEAGGAPTISDLIHKKWPGAITDSMSGEKYYASDAMGTGADYILWGKASQKSIRSGKQWRIRTTAVGPHVPPKSSKYWKADLKRPPYPAQQDHFVARLAIQLLRTVHPRAQLINFPGPDIEGHISGGVVSPDAMRSVVKPLDGDIGRIINAYKAAGLYKNTIFLVTADHGMIPNTRIARIHKMYRAVAATGDPEMEEEFSATTAGYLYLKDNAEAPEVAAKLQTQHFGHVEGVFYKVPDGNGFTCKAESETATKLGPAVTRAYLDLCDTFDSSSGPDVIMPYEEDTLGIRVKGYGPHWGWHGGFSWSVQHIPLIISGPGVRHGVSTFPAKLVDIAPTVEQLLGLKVPAAVDGVVLSDSLIRSDNALQAAESAVSGRRSADVDALRQHSLSQHGVYLTHHLYH
ncbi:MAG: alkaline phosphatase family protein [Chloroflexota bacterium]